MKKTFFDYIASADSEKVHSQTIGWIFSENCDALTPLEKSQILRNITKSDCNFKIENCFVEISDIDILIVCNDTIIVIENKIKASESESQLPKYYEIVENGELSYLKKNRKRFYVYLTLFEESASDKRYIDFNYSKLYNLINQLNKKVKLSSKSDYILSDYLETINQLTSSIKWVDSKFNVRKWVFENTKYKKNNQLTVDTSNSDEINYIISNGLVRQMQKYYFKRVKDNLTLSPNCFKISFGSSPNNGEGLIQIDFLEYFYSYNGFHFQIGYQIQGSVVKINTASENYNNSTTDQLHPDIKDIIEDLKKTVNFKYRNPPQTKAYYSISKPLTNKVYYYSPSELAEYISKEITDIEKDIKIFWGKLK